LDLVHQPVVGQAGPAEKRLVAADPEVAGLVLLMSALGEGVLVVDDPGAIGLDLAPGVRGLAAHGVEAFDVALQEQRKALAPGEELQRPLLVGSRRPAPESVLGGAPAPPGEP